MMPIPTICRHIHLSQIAFIVIISLWGFLRSLLCGDTLLTTDKAFLHIMAYAAPSQSNRDMFKHIRIEFEDIQNLPLKWSTFPEPTKLSSSIFLLRTSLAIYTVGRSDLMRQVTMATNCKILTLRGLSFKHKLRLLAVNFKDPTRILDAFLS